MFNLKKDIKNSILAKQSLLMSEEIINEVILEIYKKIKNNGKVFLCGNGGSAADAQHLAAEFLVRLRPKINRKPIAAIALAMDTSTITACGNDYSFENIYSRNLDALASSRDVLIVISTSGNSKNILKALKLAKKKKILSIGFYGNKGGVAKKFTDLSIVVKSSITARVQEAHIFLGHYIFEQIENKLIKNLKN